MNIIPLIIKKDAPPWPSETIALMATMSSTPNRGQMFIFGVDTSIVGVSTILMQDGQWHKEVKWAPKNHHSYPPRTQIRLRPLEILLEDSPHSKRRQDYYYRATTFVIKKEKPVLYIGETKKKRKSNKILKKGKGKERPGKTKVTKKYPTKDKGQCFHYRQDGHWKRNYKDYLAEKAR
ncbi:hypothetical protein B296_00051430 [Ensete ventricosum]|uniref:Uncharacterized protein n=1 Tax=Ensete ventricosum TaxID=4639 RepID=A0A426WW54_ENSVE|nr:hypothetical protein B296_00051430 [Ensete ventricosum]